MITGNKGEWSELYVLLRLLADGKLYAADADLHKLDQVYFPILAILRQELESGKMEYRLNEKRREVTLYWNGDKIKSIGSDKLSEYADSFYSGILAGNRSSFAIPNAEKMMEDIKCTKIKAPSSDKTDITLRVYDRKTGFSSVVGYSIKSELGNAPTLLNASGATNFRYMVTGLTEEAIRSVNGIDTKAKMRDRINTIEQCGSLKFDRACNNVFSGNLLLIDSMMEDIISFMLLEYYKNGLSFCSEITTALERRDPLGYHREGVYRYKIKKFLCAVALGMMPSKKWSGQDEANGGYIIVKESGEVLAYHLYNRNMFENYLLNNTKLERKRLWLIKKNLITAVLVLKESSIGLKNILLWGQY